MARSAEGGLLEVRRKHDEASEAIDPKVFVQNVLFMLRFGRDELLQQTPAANRAIVSTRLDRMIEAAKAAFESCMTVPLDRIVCNKPECTEGGQHLLPGPWVDAMRECAEASLEAHSLWTFLQTSDGVADVNGEAMRPSKPKRKVRKERKRSVADHVRELLTGDAPYEKNKTQLAAEVGYTHPSSLASVKNFANLWSENERKLAGVKAQRARSMTRLK